MIPLISIFIVFFVALQCPLNGTQSEADSSPTIQSYSMGESDFWSREKKCFLNIEVLGEVENLVEKSSNESINIFKIISKHLKLLSK